MACSTISSPESFITSLILELSQLSSSASLPFQSSVSSTSPSSHTNFTSLLSRLPSTSQESVKRLLTTLHFIFPHELIPALDLLDRRLVTRLIAEAASVSPAPGTAAEATTTLLAEDGSTTTNQAITSGNEVFYVQSASASSTSASSRTRHNYNSNCSYEVRLSAWNCTCPAFAFSAFSRTSALHDLNEYGHQLGPANAVYSGEDEHESSLTATDAWRGFMFGGTLTTYSSSTSDSGHASESPPLTIPVCKHILAACLGKQVPGLFDSGVQTRADVSLDEVAGWAGGWAD